MIIYFETGDRSKFCFTYEPRCFRLILFKRRYEAPLCTNFMAHIQNIFFVMVCMTGSDPVGPLRRHCDLRLQAIKHLPKKQILCYTPFRHSVFARSYTGGSIRKTTDF